MMRVGGYGYHFPPFETAVGSAVGMDEGGMDWIMYGDQMCWTHPTSMWSPAVTDVATALPSIEAFLDPATIIAAAGAQTKRIRFAWGPLDVVRRSPNVIAQTLLSLDHATGGRAVGVLANGENKQMKPYGVARKGANDKLIDTVQLVKRWVSTSEPISFDGRVWKVRDGKVALPHVGERPPQVWVAGGTPATLELIGQHADGWFIYAPGGIEDDVDVFKEQVAILHRAARDAGRDPSEIAIAMVLLTVLDEDRDRVEPLRDHPFVRWQSMLATPTSATYKKWGLEHPYGYDWMFSRDCIPPWVERDEWERVVAATPDEAVDHTWYIGTPEDVRDRVAPLLDTGFVTELFVGNYTPMLGLEYMESGPAAAARFLGLVTGRETESAALRIFV